eukprot:1558293-Rhodomonas_salina.1
MSRSKCLEQHTGPCPAERPTADCTRLECCTQPRPAERPTAGREANALNVACDHARPKGPLQVVKQMP